MCPLSGKSVEFRARQFTDFTAGQKMRHVVEYQRQVVAAREMHVAARGQKVPAGSSILLLLLLLYTVSADPTMQHATIDWW